MYTGRSSGNKVQRVIRLIIDVLNVLLGVLVVCLAILAFVNTGKHMWMFPLIFLFGGFMNTITGIKHIMSDRVTIGVIAEVVSAFLYIVSYISYSAIGG